MKELKLTIELLPKGAWNNDFSKTLSQKDWDILRKECYKRANHKCQICGFETDDLDAHEVWDFDIKKKTQTLKDIIGICSKCHGVKHIRNSQRLGYGDSVKKHFLLVNGCTELEYAAQLTQAELRFQELNKIYRWKIVANLKSFGLEGVTLNSRIIPFIKNPYKNVEWSDVFCIKHNMSKLFYIDDNTLYYPSPKVREIIVDNYQGLITIKADNANKIEWYLDGAKIKTKYNVVGEFSTTFKVEDLCGKQLKFALFGDGGRLSSKIFELSDREVL